MKLTERWNFWIRFAGQSASRIGQPLRDFLGTLPKALCAPFGLQGKSFLQVMHQTQREKVFIPRRTQTRL